MPGTRLSDTERRLANWWNQDVFAPPVLRSLSVEGTPGLRGITDLTVEFKYPLTALCGQNGSGKTTILALAALAFGGSPGHFPRAALRRTRAGEQFNYYTFRDFFFRGSGDPDVVGITISWNYAGTFTRQGGRPGVTPIVVRKRGDKWMHYERRLSKPVDYVGVARSIPAVEQRVLRTHFGAAARRFRRAPLDQDYLGRLSEIMGRPYTDAEIMSTSRYAIRSCGSGGSSYSSFNMGAGEDILIELLYVLQEAPNGALVVIEEIELGLHPEATVRLARHLQEIMWSKRLQVIVSTHSHHFLDAVPREARVLIQRNGDIHHAIHGPTARFATGAMAGEADPELIVYCEDGFALSVIGAALTADLRKRSRIVAIGSNSELVAQALYHHRAGFGQLQLIVWDGDVSDAELRASVKKTVDQGALLADLRWSRLPGAGPPETWILTELDTAEGRVRLGHELGESADRATQWLTELRSLGDPHQVVHALATKAGLRDDEAQHALIRAVRGLPTRPLEPIRIAVESALRRDAVQEPPYSTPIAEVEAPAA